MRHVFRFRNIVAVLVLIGFVDVQVNFRRSYVRYFGMHPIHGGFLGVKVDRYFIQKVIDRTARKQRDQLKDLAVALPGTHTTKPTELLQINTNAALREHLMKRERRSLYLIDLEESAEKYQRNCQNEPKYDPLQLFQKPTPEIFPLIPQVLFVPNTKSWKNPRPGKPGSFRKVEFLEMEMRELMEDTFSSMLDTFSRLETERDRIVLWSICAVYFYGGLFVSDTASYHEREVQAMMNGEAKSIFSSRNGTDCTQPIGYLSFTVNPNQDAAGVHRGTKVNTSTNRTEPDLFLLAATPRHPHIRCLLSALEDATTMDALTVLSAFSLGTLDMAATAQRFQDNTVPRVEEITTQCGYGHAHTPHCCRNPVAKAMDRLPHTMSSSDLNGRFFLHRHDPVVPAQALSSTAVDGPTVNVEVKVKEGTEAPVKGMKLPFQNRLDEQGLAPGWFCNRCLKTSLYGSFTECRPFCPRGYERAMCDEPDDPEKAEVIVEVNVRGYGTTPKRIPSIIHQTWSEELSPDRYPALLRLQQSWKNAGWDYRFYTDETALEYIRENFPPRFVDAFDSVIPGAYKVRRTRFFVRKSIKDKPSHTLFSGPVNCDSHQHLLSYPILSVLSPFLSSRPWFAFLVTVDPSQADLFRYLVLLKDGGIYADVDIMLDGNLDNFVTESLSFFAARDVVCEYADESFCLWNGLMGSEPGHPFMIRAVERVVNLILDRADMYDMERDACRKVGPAVETWKVRSEPLLLSSGPCSLGIAVNDALGRGLLSKFDIGWLSMDGFVFEDQEPRDYGDVLIMVVSRHTSVWSLTSVFFSCLREL